MHQITHQQFYSETDKLMCVVSKIIFQVSCLINDQWLRARKTHHKFPFSVVLLSILTSSFSEMIILLALHKLLFFVMQCYAITANYDETLARKMLSMSAAAYSSSSKNCLKSDPLKEDDWKHSQYLDEECDILSSTCAALIAVSDKKRQIAIAFRGTTTKSQLFLEAVGSLSPGMEFFGIGFVHQYFKNGLIEVWDSVNSTLAEGKTKDYEVVFTGHSLGWLYKYVLKV